MLISQSLYIKSASRYKMLICQKASLHLLITQVLPQAVHDLLRVRGQPQWHLLHLPQQAHLREGLQRECALELANIDARYLLYLLYLLLQSVQKTCSECGCRISDVYYTLDSGKVVCEADYRVTYSNILHCYHGQPLSENPGYLQEVLTTCGGEAGEAVRLSLPSPVFQLPGEEIS